MYSVLCICFVDPVTNKLDMYSVFCFLLQEGTIDPLSAFLCGSSHEQAVPTLDLYSVLCMCCKSVIDPNFFVGRVTNKQYLRFTLYSVLVAGGCYRSAFLCGSSYEKAVPTLEK